jgi:hypothetical protein
MSGRFGLICGALIAVASSAFPEEAVRGDGSRIAGQLSFTDARQFKFISEGRDVPIADLDLVRFKHKSRTAPAVPLWHMVRLSHGELFVAEIRKLDATHLHVRTSWADPLAIPRSVVERVTHLPGSRPVFFDSFDGDLAAWKVSGEPRIADGRLVLNHAGQSVAATLKQALPAGRVAIGFRSERTKARNVAIELGFVREGKPVAIRVELIAPHESYAINSPAKPKHSQLLKRDATTCRLSVEFDRQRLDVFLGDLVLWTQEEGPGELHSLKLVSEGEGAESAALDDVLVTRPEAAGEEKSWAALTSDAIRSPEGDETFGVLTSVGSSGVTLEVKGRKHTTNWPDVAEFGFRRGAIQVQATAGEHLRILVRSSDESRDILEGAVKSFDDKALVLIHPTLGELTIPRELLEELRFLFRGRQLPVDSTAHHLGAKPAFGFAVTKPEGMSFKKTVRLESPSTSSGFIVVDAARLSGAGTKLEVLLNGESLGELNRQADRADAAVRTYRLPLPATTPKEVEFELRLKPPQDGGRIDGVDVRAIRLELREAR